jgi:3-methyladenine DNA glycosylase AlkD
VLAINVKAARLKYNLSEFIMDGIISWDLCDLLCKNILIKQKDFDHFIQSWINSDKLYFKRAAFTLIASTSTHASLICLIRIFLHNKSQRSQEMMPSIK